MNGNFCLQNRTSLLKFYIKNVRKQGFNSDPLCVEAGSGAVVFESDIWAYIALLNFMDLSSDRWLGGVSPRKGEVHSPDPGSEHGPSKFKQKYCFKKLSVKSVVYAHIKNKNKSPTQVPVTRTLKSEYNAAFFAITITNMSLLNLRAIIA